MKVRRIVSVITLVMVFAMMIVPLEEASAAKKMPYKNVTVKKVGKLGYKSIKWMYQKGYYKGIVKGKKFPTNKKPPTKVILKILQKHCKKKNITITVADKKAYKKTANFKYVYTKLLAANKRNNDAYMFWDPRYKDSTKVTYLRLAIVLAALDNPYTDVTTKTVHLNQLYAIKYNKEHKIYVGIASGKKLGPNAFISEYTFVKMLENGYPANKIPVAGTNKVATFGWLYATLSDLGVNLGEPVNFTNKQSEEKEITMAQASNILWLFATAHPKLRFKQ